MIRKFNYTDRKRILRDKVSFEWIDGKNGGPASFGATLDLRSVDGLRADGLLWVEAYSGTTVARFHFGTVEEPIPPEDTSLTAFPRGLKPHFRIKVVDPDDPHKRLLAFADKIAPAEREDIESGRQSILPVEYVDLGQRIWNLRMDDSEAVLQLNSTITEPVSIATLAKTSEFIALVYPAVIRQILTRLLLETDEPAMASDHDWVIFGNNLLARTCPDPEDFGDNEEDFQREAREWIDDVVDEFCRARNARDSYVSEKKDQHQDG